MTTREASDEELIAGEIDQLPASMREALVLTCGLGLDTTAVAEVLEIEPGAVWTRLSRARAQLRRSRPRPSSQRSSPGTRSAAWPPERFLAWLGAAD